MSLRGVLANVKTAFRRLVGLYLNPVDTFREIKLVPDVLPPILLIALSFSAYALTSTLLLWGLRLKRGTEEKELVTLLYSVSTPGDVALAIALRGAAVISIWFLAFILLWLALYFSKVRIDGFTVFSSTGYILGSSLPAYLAAAAIYAQTLSMPYALLSYSTNPVFRYLLTTIILYRAYVSPLGPLTLIAADLLFRFVTMWEAFLFVCAVKGLGELSWLRSTIGGVLVAVAVMFVATVYHEVGLL